MNICLLLCKICLGLRQWKLLQTGVWSGDRNILLVFSYNAQRLYLLHGNLALRRKSRVKPVKGSVALISATHPGFTTQSHPPETEDGAQIGRGRIGNNQSFASTHLLLPNCVYTNKLILYTHKKCFCLTRDWGLGGLRFSSKACLIFKSP